MLSALARFSGALRTEGIPVSPAETLDAVRAAEAIGVEDRARFRAALCAALVKNRRDLPRFDRVFDAHFASPPRPRRDRGKKAGAVDGTGERSPREAQGRERSRRRDDSRRDPSREEVHRAVAGRSPGGERRRGRLRRVVRAAEEDRSAAVPGRPVPPLRRDLRSPMGEEDERRLAAELPRIVLSLRRASSRRFRRASSGRLWARRIFRENVSHEGVPFVLPRQRRRRREPRVVLLVDVSWSVSRAAGLFLWMAASLLDVGRRVKVVAFVDRPVDATEALRAWMRGRPGSGIARGGVSFAEWLEGLRGLALHAPSDYGRALHALLRSHLRPAGSDTVLVVLGDARTNRFEPLPWTLEEIGRRCRAVLWLVPEPAGRWGTGDSALGAYLPHVDVAVEAPDLAGLARGVAELMRTL